MRNLFVCCIRCSYPARGVVVPPLTKNKIRLRLHNPATRRCSYFICAVKFFFHPLGGRLKCRDGRHIAAVRCSGETLRRRILRDLISISLPIWRGHHSERLCGEIQRENHSTAVPFMQTAPSLPMGVSKGHACGKLSVLFMVSSHRDE